MATFTITGIIVVSLATISSGLLLNSTGQNTLQTEVQELRQKVTILEREVQKLKVPTVVAFLAELSGANLTPKAGQHLIYNKVHLNNGNGYHKFHGLFIAPVSGTYFINAAATVSEGTDQSAHIEIKKNGSMVGYMFFDSLQGKYLKNRESIIIHLNESDEVWVEVTSSSVSTTILSTYMHTYFSGFLINED